MCYTIAGLGSNMLYDSRVGKFYLQHTRRYFSLVFLLLSYGDETLNDAVTFFSISKEK